MRFTISLLKSLLIGFATALVASAHQAEHVLLSNVQVFDGKTNGLLRA